MTATPNTNPDTEMNPSCLQDQSGTIALLSDPSTYRSGTESAPDVVDLIETHGAMVFLAGDHAYKIKKAVAFPFMDFSTLAKRHAICARELEINRTFAPDLYLGLVAVTRESDGTLALGGGGAPVEWAVHMKRFAQDQLLSSIAEDGPPGALDRALLETLADTIAEAHGQAPGRKISDGDARTGAVVDQLRTFFDDPELHKMLEPAIGAADLATLRAGLARQFEEARYGLKLRGRHGYVRRCHGDLHLGNIVMLDGRPTPFDALEFDENLATIDTLYDLAFLLMDLDERGLKQEANIVLNRYLAQTGELIDLFGLTLLPLFLSLRAGVRALVLLTQGRQRRGSEKADLVAKACPYIKAALRTLDPPAPRLIAIGGLSGTGKTTLARSLASGIGAAPGAVVLRSDVERKTQHGVAETDRLDEAAYSKAASARVFDALCQKAYTAVKAGHAVIVDAVYLRADERTAIEKMADRAGVAFQGLWLNADRDIMADRVATRTRDASDATPEIVDLQRKRGTGPVAWTPINAGHDPGCTLEQAKAVLGVG